MLSVFIIGMAVAEHDHGRTSINAAQGTKQQV